MAFLRDVTNKVEATLLRWPWRPRVFNSKVMALFSAAFAGGAILEMVDADYGSALICLGNTLLFGLWAHAQWKREQA
jgi:hypothetical protein